MKALYEQYRPHGWDELVGQDKLVQRLAILRRRGLAGRVFWITGDSGTGKTTVARLIASEIADDYAVVEIDAQDMNLDRVREFERICQFRPLGKGCHVFIVNEAHGLSSKVVMATAVYGGSEIRLLSPVMQPTMVSTPNMATTMAAPPGSLPG